MSATAARPALVPFTVDHFVAYASRLVLDTGDTWQVEDFQVEIFEPVLAGVPEVWAIVPEGNTKSTMMAGFALYHCDYTPAPWVPIGAASRDQAEILFMQAAEIVRCTPGMLSIREGDGGRFKVQEGYRRIKSERNGGRGIRVYSADANTGDGVIPTLALLDEGHRHPDLSLYRLWNGKLNKRHGQIVMISTAGEPGGDFEETRDQIRNQAPKRTRKGAHIRCEGRNIVMNEWRVERAEWISDMHRVKDANPFSGITVQSLEDQFNSPTTDLGDWKRLKCNIPSRTMQAAVTEAEWDRAYIDFDIPEGERIDLGVDVAWKHDTFAIQPLWRNEEAGFLLLGPGEILVPPRDGSSMHPDDVKAAFTAIMEINPVDAVVIDMERAEDIAHWLEDECDVVVIDRPQGNANAAEDYDAFMDGLRNKKLRHNGHAGLRSHVMNAIARALPSDKKRFDRPSQSRAKKRQTQRVIDALTAAAMVNQYASEYAGVEEPLVGWK